MDDGGNTKKHGGVRILVTRIFIKPEDDLRNQTPRPYPLS